MHDKKIIVGYDGSLYSKKALKLAVDIAEAVDADIDLLSVVDLPPLGSVYMGDIITAYTDTKRKRECAIKDGKAEAKEMGVSVTGILLEGTASEEIMKYAHAQRAYMIIVGTRGLGGFKRLLLGSTAQALTTYCDISVLVVK